MKEVLYTLLAIVLSIHLQAQSISGTVKTANGNAVAAATINILHTDKSTITNKQGEFIIKNLLPGTWQLSIGSVGLPLNYP